MPRAERSLTGLTDIAEHVYWFLWRVDKDKLGSPEHAREYFARILERLEPWSRTTPAGDCFDESTASGAFETEFACAYEVVARMLQISGYHLVPWPGWRDSPYDGEACRRVIAEAHQASSGLRRLLIQGRPRLDMLGSSRQAPTPAPVEALFSPASTKFLLRLEGEIGLEIPIHMVSRLSIASPEELCNIQFGVDSVTWPGLGLTARVSMFRDSPEVLEFSARYLPADFGQPR